MPEVMKIWLVLKQSIKHLLGKWQSSIIILISLSISVFAMLILCEGILYSSSFLSRMNTYRRTYNLKKMISDSVDTKGQKYALVEELLYGNFFDNVEEISVIQAQQDERQLSINISPIIYLTENDRYHVEIELMEGRLFTEEELQNGDNVIILGFDDGVGLGESVSIHEKNYLVIGISKKSQSYITYSNAVTSGKFKLMLSTVVFKEVLSGKELETVEQLMAQAGWGMESLYSIRVKGFILDTVLYLFLMCLILFCVASIISGLFQYMAESRRYEFAIYHVLGITKKKRWVLFFLPIGILSIGAETIGTLLYVFTDGMQNKLGFEDRLGMGYIVLVYIMTLLMLFVTATPIFMRFRKKSFTEEV